jgi:hypothetical protein
LCRRPRFRTRIAIGAVRTAARCGTRVVAQTSRRGSGAPELNNARAESSRAPASLPFVLTTLNKQKLEHAVGPTVAIEIGLETDLHRVVTAVEAAWDDRV